MFPLHSFGDIYVSVQSKQIRDEGIEFNSRFEPLSHCVTWKKRKPGRWQTPLACPALCLTICHCLMGKQSIWWDSVRSRRERRFYYEMLIFFLFIICRCNDITGKFEYFLQSGSKKVVHLCRPLKIEHGNFMWTECAPANVGSQISLCSC